MLLPKAKKEEEKKKDRKNERRGSIPVTGCGAQ
jgi:hypothetical protein